MARRRVDESSLDKLHFDFWGLVYTEREFAVLQLIDVENPC
jgi:hypothetical protein